jgi:hypothetical protein
MPAPLIDIFSGIADMGGHLIELYRLKRDGTFAEQQRLMSALRIEEAERVEASLAERQLDAAIAAEAGAQQSRQHDIDRDLLHARLEVAVHRERAQIDYETQNNPFAYDREKAVSIIADATRGGSLPALLIAPFYHDHLSGIDNDTGPRPFKTAIRTTWSRKDWNDLVAPVDGVIGRPLRNTDADIIDIKHELRELPVILVYGHVQDNQRLWVSVESWNLAPRRGVMEVPSVRVDLPPMLLPARDEPHDRLTFEDALGERVALIVGVLSEWFHVVRSGRQPRLHTTTAIDNFAGKRYIAAVTASAYDIAIEWGKVSVVEARAEQAMIYWECGLRDLAIEAAQHSKELVLSELPPREIPRRVLRNLGTILAMTDDGAGAHDVHDLLEKRARREVLDFFHLGRQ